jgi:hypothetical protein
MFIPEIKKPLQIIELQGFVCCVGDPDRIRTCDPQIRNLLLYPAELRNRRYLISSNRVQMYNFILKI